MKTLLGNDLLAMLFGVSRWGHPWLWCVIPRFYTPSVGDPRRSRLRLSLSLNFDKTHRGQLAPRTPHSHRRQTHPNPPGHRSQFSNMRLTTYVGPKLAESNSRFENMFFGFCSLLFETVPDHIRDHIPKRFGHMLVPSWPRAVAD